MGLSGAHTSGKDSTLDPDVPHGHAADGCSRLLREHLLEITCVGHAQDFWGQSLSYRTALTFMGTLLDWGTLHIH